MTDVGLVGIGGHSSDLLCVAGEIGEKPQHLKHRCGSTIPVAGPFVATAIFRVGVDEDLGGLPDLPDGFCLARLVFLADEYAGQPVGAYPGVPVHASLLPPVVLLDSRLEDAALYLTVDALAEVGRELVELRLEHIARPGYKIGRLCIEEVHRLVFGQGRAWSIVSGDAPPSLFTETADSIDDIGHKPAFTLHDLCHHECSQVAAFFEVQTFIVHAVAVGPEL